MWSIYQRWWTWLEIYLCLSSLLVRKSQLEQSETLLNKFSSLYFLIFSYAISLIGFVLLYRPAENRPEECSTISNSTTTLGEIDFIGSFLLLAGLLPLLMGLSWANNPYPVTSLYVIVPIAIGCVSFILFGLYEWKGRTDGLVHHELFSQSRNFAICLVLIFVEGLIFFAFTIWLPQETTLVYEHDSFTVGVRYAAYFGSTVFMSGIAGWLATKFKNGSYLTAFGKFIMYFSSSSC